MLGLLRCSFLLLQDPRAALTTSLRPRWVLLDYLDIVIHVQHAEERIYYALERLWKDCPRVPLPEPVGVARGAPGAAQDADLGEIQ